MVMAQTFAGAGAKRVYILGRRIANLENVASQHPSITPLICNVTSKPSLQNAVDTITKEIGYVNLVIANSGALGPMNSFNTKMKIHDLRKNLFVGVSMESFTESLHLNLTGAYFTMLAFLELLDAGNKHALEGGFGAPLKAESQVPSIQSHGVFIGSIGSFSRYSFTPPAYMGSKAAIIQLAKQAATNLAPYQIISIPWPLDVSLLRCLLEVHTLTMRIVFSSEMTNAVIAPRDPESETLDHPNFMPARRFGTDEEMDGSILCLASRAGAYCNGLVLLNDGGRVAVIPSTYWYVVVKLRRPAQLTPGVSSLLATSSRSSDKRTATSF